MTRLIASLVATSLAMLGAVAHAEPEGTSDGRATGSLAGVSVGARIGGYGFRRDEGDRRSAWDECRMNGLGVFATKALGPALFVEAGVDGYFSEPWPMQGREGDLPISRASALLSTAIGARMALHPRVAAYVQVGAGIEFTSVSVPYGDAGELAAMKALPDAYLGVGGELRVFGRAHAGASLRVHAMGNFDYDPAKLEMQPGWQVPPSANSVFDASADVAAQGQFYVRYEL